MNYTFLHIGSDGVDVTVEVPERGLDEMCEYFERFLVACGYVLDRDQHIRAVVDKPEETLSFNFNNYCADFGDDNIYVGSGVLGGMGEDHIQFSSYAAGPVPIPGAAGKDIITFS